MTVGMGMRTTNASGAFVVRILAAHRRSLLFTAFSRLQMLTPSGFWGYHQLRATPGAVQLRQQHKPNGVRMAINRTRKEETVEMARKQLEACYTVLYGGLSFGKLKGLDVKNLQGLRSSLPEWAKLVVAKNKFIGKAIEGTPWKALQPCLKGMNAWLLHGEEIPAAITPFRTLQKDLKLDSTAFTGAVVEGSSSTGVLR